MRSYLVFATILIASATITSYASAAPQKGTSKKSTSATAKVNANSFESCMTKCGQTANPMGCNRYCRKDYLSTRYRRW